MSSPHTVTHTTSTRSSIACANTAAGIREALAEVDPDARFITAEVDDVHGYTGDSVRSWLRIEFETIHDQEQP